MLNEYRVLVNMRFIIELAVCLPESPTHGVTFPLSGLHAEELLDELVGVKSKPLSINSSLSTAICNGQR